MSTAHLKTVKGFYVQKGFCDGVGQASVDDSKIWKHHQASWHNSWIDLSSNERQEGSLGCRAAETVIKNSKQSKVIWCTPRNMVSNNLNMAVWYLERMEVI